MENKDILFKFVKDNLDEILNKVYLDYDYMFKEYNIEYENIDKVKVDIDGEGDVCLKGGVFDSMGVSFLLEDKDESIKFNLKGVVLNILYFNI